MKSSFNYVLLSLLLISSYCVISTFDDFIDFNAKTGDKRIIDNLSTNLSHVQVDTILRFQGGAPHDPIIALRDNTTYGPRDSHMQFYKSGAGFKGYFCVANNVPDCAQHAFTFNMDTWYTIRWIYNKSAKTLELFVDGTSQGTINYSTTHDIKFSNGHIGGCDVVVCTTTRYFYGQMKKFVIMDLSTNTVVTKLYAGCSELANPNDHFQIHDDYWNGSPICGGTCGHTCKTCIVNSTTCRSCPDSSFRVNDETCACIERYYNSGTNPICQPCPMSNCLKCDDGATCTICEDGWFINGSNTCSQCDHPCTKCVDNSTKCTECVDDTNGNRITFPDCTCKESFWNDGTNPLCQPCTSNCLQCSTNGTVCTQCEDGWFIDGSNTCSQCSHPCIKCVDNSTKCTECVDDTNGNRLIIPDCTCKEGYYNQGINPVCQPCPVNCIQCSDNLTCTQCEDGWFVNSSNLCQQCVHPCTKCGNSANECTECVVDANNNRKTTPTCECKDTFFNQGTQTNCISCPLNKCLKCGTLTTCVQCEEGWFVNSLNECEQCQDPCKNCENSSNNCTECIADENRVQDSTCKCSDGYFDNSIDLLCQSCDYRKCGTCTTSAQTCDTPCKNDCALCKSDGNCTSCKLGNYLNGDNCESCHPKCYSCDLNNRNLCTICQQAGIGRSMNIDQNCGCLDGYYEDPNELNCQKCKIDGCKRCDSNLDCLECSALEAFLPNCLLPKKGKYISHMIDTEGESELVEQQCNAYCESCTESQGNCQSCKIGSFRARTPPCLCLPGFHDNEGQFINCEKCPVKCELCLNKDTCTKCKASSNSMLNEFNGKCECIQGYTEDPQSSQCIQCYNYGGKCFSKCPEHTVKNENDYICEQITFLTSDHISLIWICFIVLLVSILTLYTLSSTIAKKKKTQIQMQNLEQVQNLH